MRTEFNSPSNHEESTKAPRASRAEPERCKQLRRRDAGGESWSGIGGWMWAGDGGWRQNWWDAIPIDPLASESYAEGEFTMILEVAILDIGKGTCDDFEAAYREASPIIASMPGYISHELRRCIEKPSRYILL